MNKCTVAHIHGDLVSMDEIVDKILSEHYGWNSYEITSSVYSNRAPKEYKLKYFLHRGTTPFDFFKFCPRCGAKVDFNTIKETTIARFEFQKSIDGES